MSVGNNNGSLQMSFQRPWTKTHPYVDANGCPFNIKGGVVSVVVDKCIYSIADCVENEEVRPALFMFDTETSELIKINCAVVDGYQLEDITSDGEKLYLFYVQHSRSFPSNLKLYEFNRKTAISTEVFDCQCRYIYGRPQANNGVVYFLEDTENDKEASLVKIDVAKKDLERILMSECCHFPHLLMKNDKLYVYDRQYSHRIIWVINEDNELVILHSEQFTEDNYGWRDNGMPIKTDWFDGNLILTFKDGNEKRLLLDSFNFDKLQWHRVKLENVKALSSCFSNFDAVQVGDFIFAHNGTSVNDGRIWNIIQWELKPSLTNLCLLNMAKEVNSKKEIDNFVCRVPIPLRSEFTNIIKTRRWAKTGSQYEFFEYVVKPQEPPPPRIRLTRWEKRMIEIDSFRQRR